MPPISYSPASATGCICNRYDVTERSAHPGLGAIGEADLADGKPRRDLARGEDPGERLLMNRHDAAALMGDGGQHGLARPQQVLLAADGKADGMIGRARLDACREPADIVLGIDQIAGEHPAIL